MTEQEFKIHVFSCRDKMFRFAKRLLESVDDAQDVVQELLLKFWNKRFDLGAIENLEAYLMRCVKNECLSRLRHISVKREYEKSQIINIIQPDKTTQDVKDWILKFIQELPEKQKMVIHLKDVEEYSMTEIAELLEMEETAVRVNLMRARNKIKEKLQQLFDYENRQIQRINT